MSTDSEQQKQDIKDAGGWRRLAVLAAILALFMGPMWTAPQRDVNAIMERLTVFSSWETKRAIAEGNARAWLVPQFGAQDRILKPPGSVWLHQLAWSDLPADAPADDFVFRARTLSMLTGLLAVAAVYWAALNLGGMTLATLSALVAGSMFSIINQARYSTYDTHLMAFSPLFMALALQAIRPRELLEVSAKSAEASSGAGALPCARLCRSKLGWWFAAGLVLSAAVYVKGPIALLLTLVPVAAVIAALPQRRSALLGLLLAAAIAALLVVPWYGYVLRDGQSGTLALEYRAKLGTEFGHTPQNPLVYLMVLGMVMPWTLYLVGGLVHPWRNSTGSARRLQLLAWLWLLIPLAIFWLYPSRKDRYIVPLMPAAAVVIAQLLVHHVNLARRGLKDPGINWLRIPHWTFIVLVSLVLPWFWREPQGFVRMLDRVTQGKLTRKLAGAIESPIMQSPPAEVFWPATAALIALAAIGCWSHFRWRPYPAAVCTALWFALVLAVTQHYNLDSRDAVRLRQFASEVRQLSPTEPMYWLEQAETDRGPLAPEPVMGMKVQFYSGQVHQTLSLQEITQKLLKKAGGQADASVLLACRPEAVDQVQSARQGFRFTPAGLLKAPLVGGGEVTYQVLRVSASGQRAKP